MGVTAVALHGFLGRGSDWHALRSAFPSWTWLTPDYAFDSLLAPSRAGLTQWGDAFHRWLGQNAGSEPVILIGYSQGGRLALHALEKNPEAFKKVILISAQPGLPESEKSARLANDEAWARRFENDPWKDVVASWNRLPVFVGGDAEPERPESPEARRAAADSLRAWSVGRQNDFRSLMREQRDRLILVAGERDPKYAEMTKALASEGFETHIVKNSGHRVLFDAPAALATITSGGLRQSR